MGRGKGSRSGGNGTVGESAHGGKPPPAGAVSAQGIFRGEKKCPRDGLILRPRLVGALPQRRKSRRCRVVAAIFAIQQARVLCDLRRDETNAARGERAGRDSWQRAFLRRP